MKTTLKVEGATRVSGVPSKLAANASASGRLIKGEKYRVIGYCNMPKTTTIPDGWTGVAIERLSTGTHSVVGVNTLLGKSIVYVGKDTIGASEKGYKVYEVAGNCFTTVNDFQSTDEDDNNTIFAINDLKLLPSNEVIRPKDAAHDDKYLKTKEKQFYLCGISKETAV